MIVAPKALVALILATLVLAAVVLRALRPERLPRWRAAKTRRSSIRCPPKPAWVAGEVLRLKALMPDSGCRKIAITFNWMHARRGMTIGKTFVASHIRRSQHEIVRLRRELKHKRPRPLPRNRVWGLDLTTVQDNGQPRTLLGLVDHGTRACLALRVMLTKASLAILRVVLDIVERFGPPKYLRTDNEAVFTSRLFRVGLRLLRIRHQRTAPFAPWQNGRIERLFGTLKERLRLWLEQGRAGSTLQQDLDLVRIWYNHVRPHQHLDGLTPAMAWSGELPDTRRQPQYFQEWDGILAGFYVPP
jgi:transposase InsO family protein